MPGYKKLDSRIEKLPKLSRFWRLTTTRKVHYFIAEHKGDPPMSADIPKALIRKTWLAKLLNESIFIECYDGTSYEGWRQIFYWPARKLKNH